MPKSSIVLPIKYLGVPISTSRLHVRDWLLLEEKHKKKLVTWMGSTMSIARRTTLINSSLTNTFIYHMFMYLLPKTLWINIEDFSFGEQTTQNENTI
jgi:hypothetical protein